MLILRGVPIVLAVIVATLAGDAVSVLRAPVPLTSSTAGALLLAGLAILTLLVLVVGATWLAAIGRLRAVPTLPADPVPGDFGALAEVIADLWALAAAPAEWLSSRVPMLRPLWRAVDRLAHRLAAAWEAHLPGLSPRAHPWRFFGLVALLLSPALVLVEGLVEGGPPSAAILVLLLVIFTGAEVSAAMGGFLLLGGYLGLRPALGGRRR